MGANKTMDASYLIESRTGLVTAIPYHPSPHQDARPTDEISLIVIHGISLPEGIFSTPYIDDLFMGRLAIDQDPSFAPLKNLKVSAHIVIFRSGQMIQYVPFHRRAWHAGVSNFNGRSACNDFSIGIELEGTDSLPYEEAQYRTLRRLLIALQSEYRIPNEQVVGHAHIAPGRKTDPGPAFQWEKIR